MAPVRCRFAPSPTGYLHVGSAQSALFNWLFARHTGGELLLRIEDTDAERNRPELAGNILDMLRWLGIDWNGEPVRQSDRFELYAAAAGRLVADGHTYYCDCTAEQVRSRNRATGGKPGYDGHCRDHGLGPGHGRALRFRTPDFGQTAWNDVVRGAISFEQANIEDFVVVRSNGMPMFLLANVVDDADMAITHVIRGEDHVNNTPKYLLLWRSLGYGEEPMFAHLPLLVNEHRKKLSKRRDDVSVADFKSKGFLPEAMRNYLALLGWGPADGIEIRPIQEIAELFRLEDVNPSAAFFDMRKLAHINGEYIRLLSSNEFLKHAIEFVPPVAHGALRALGPLAQERIKVLADLAELFDWITGPVDDRLSWNKAMTLPLANVALERSIERFASVEWKAASLHVAFLELADALDVRPAKLQGPVRVALTGRIAGLPLFEILECLGRHETLIRLRSAVERLNSAGLPRLLEQ